METLDRIVESAAAQGAAQVLETLGISSGEISQRKARERYGKWFVDAEKAGRIQPSRVGNGANGKRCYRVVEIQKLKTADLIRAELAFKNL